MSEVSKYRHHKQIAQTLLINDSISFSINYVENILEELRKKYERKCFSGSYIQTITKLIEYTPFVIIDDLSTSSGKVNVLFEVIVEYFPITSNLILEIKSTDPLISLSYNNYLYSILKSKLKLSIGQYLPCILSYVKYNPMSDKVKSISEVFTRASLQDSNNYIITNLNVSESEKKIISKLLYNITIEKQRRESHNKGILRYFENIYGIKQLDTDIIDNEENIYKPNMSVNINGYSILEQKQAPLFIELVSMSFLLDKVYNLYWIINELCVFYDEDLIDKHKGIFEYIKLN